MPRTHGHAGVSTLVLTLALAVGGCSGSKAPSQANFRKALEPVVADAFCRTIPALSMPPGERSENAAYPLTVAIAPAPTVIFDPSYDRASVEMLDAAVRGGLLTRREGDVVVRPRGTSGETVRQRTATYAPTAAGAAYFRAVERSNRAGRMLHYPNVCGATGELLEVVRWSEPADFGGRRVSRVTYRYRGVDPIPLATPADRAKVAETRDVTVPMVLESDGWRVMSR